MERHRVIAAKKTYLLHPLCRVLGKKKVLKMYKGREEVLGICMYAQMKVKSLLLPMDTGLSISLGPGPFTKKGCLAPVAKGVTGPEALLPSPTCNDISMNRIWEDALNVKLRRAIHAKKAWWEGSFAEGGTISGDLWESRGSS